MLIPNVRDTQIIKKNGKRISLSLNSKHKTKELKQEHKS
jgi:hypothetical protein